MSVQSSKKTEQFYKAFAETELTFNSQTILASGLNPREIYFKVGEQHVPCVLYATSMKGARVIAELGRGTLDTLAKSGNHLSLRFALKAPGELSPVTFFVPARAESFTEFNSQKPQAKFITLSYINRPPDALITTLGSLLEIKKNAAQRKDERIVLTDEAMRQIGLESKESCVAVEGATRRCILRDISFGGARVLMTAQGSPREPQSVTLKLARCELKDDTVMDGSVVRVENVEGRADLVALSIRYSSDPPLGYKQKINSYFVSQGLW